MREQTGTDQRRSNKINDVRGVNTDKLEMISLKFKFRLNAVYLITFGILFLLYVLTTVQARVYNVLALESLSRNGLLIHDDIRISFMVLPYAFKHFNERSGVILPWLATDLQNCNATLKLIENKLQDDEYTVNVAMAKFIQAFGNVTGTVDFVHGPASSEVLQTVALTAGAVRLPLVSYVSTSERLSTDVYSTLYRVIPGDYELAQAFVALLVQFNVRTVGLLHTNDAYGAGFRELIENAAEPKKIRVRAAPVGSSTTGVALENELRSALEDFKEENINFVIRVFVTVEQVVTMARLAKDMDMIKGVVHIDRRSISFDSILTGAGNNTNTVLEFYHGSIGITTVIDTTNPYHRNLQKAFPNFDPHYVNSFLPPGTTKLGQPYAIPDDYFKSINVDSLRSFAIAYDSVIALGVAACAFESSGGSLASQLSSENFLGTTGQVQFTKRRTRQLEGSGLRIALFNDVLSTNAPKRLVTHEAGRFESKEWTFSQPLVFSDGSNAPPRDGNVPVTTVASIPLGAKIVGYFEALIGLLAGVWALWSSHWRAATTSLFPKTIPLYFSFLAIGVVFLSTSIVFITVENSIGCSTFMWLSSLGFTMVTASLCAKALFMLIAQKRRQRSSKTEKASETAPSAVSAPQVTNADGNGSHRTMSTRSEITRREIIIPVAFMFVSIGAMLAILIADQSTAPPSFEKITTETNEDGYELSAVNLCSDSSKASKAYSIAIFAFVSFLALLSFFLPLLIRRDKFEDAGTAAMAGLCIFQIFVVGVPSIFAAKDTPLARFLVQSSSAFLVSMVIICTMFVPKVLDWKHQTWNFAPFSSMSRRMTKNGPRSPPPRPPLDQIGTRSVRQRSQSIHTRDLQDDSQVSKIVAEPNAEGAFANTAVVDSTYESPKAAGQHLGMFDHSTARRVPSFVDLAHLHGLMGSPVKSNAFSSGEGDEPASDFVKRTVGFEKELNEANEQSPTGKEHQLDQI